MTIRETEATDERVISTTDQALLDSTKETFTQIIEQIKNFVIADDAGLDRATDMVKSIKLGNRELEKRRKERVDPYNEMVRQINNAFKGLQKMGEGAVQTLGGQMTGYHEQVEARLRKEEEDRRRLEAEELARQQAELERQEAEAVAAHAAAEDTPAVDFTEEKEAIKERQQELAGPILKAPKSISLGNTGSSSTRKVWKFELVDITKVPERYLQLNETAVRAAIQSGTRNISGLKVFQKSTLVVR